MKKSLEALVFLVLISGSLQAQTGFGVKAGYNMSIFKAGDEKFYETNYRHGYNIGLFLNFPVNDAFSVETDVLFSTAGGWGYSVAPAYTVGTDTYESYHDEFIRLNYIAVPVLVKYSYGPVNVHAGPQLSILSRALVDDHHRGYRTYIDSNLVPREENSGWYVKTKDVQQFYKMLDLGFVAGLGCEVDRFYFAARYYIGVMNVSKTEGSLNNRYLQASVGFRLSQDY